MSLKKFESLFNTHKPIIAMVHLPALPGSPLFNDKLGLDYILVEKAESVPPRAAQLLANCLTQHLSDVLSEWSKKFDMHVPKS